MQYCTDVQYNPCSKYYENKDNYNNYCAIQDIATELNYVDETVMYPGKNLRILVTEFQEYWLEDVA